MYIFVIYYINNLIHVVNTYYCLKIYSKNQILTKIYTSISIVSYNNLEEKRHEKHIFKGREGKKWWPFR